MEESKPLGTQSITFNQSPIKCENKNEVGWPTKNTKSRTGG